METEYYGGEPSDDGGATPVQDERDSGSDMEENGNEQHSGSENGSIGQHSENELSDGEDNRQTTEHPMTDSENEDTPRQKHSDSENEDAPNDNVSDSENEGTHRGKDSDSDNEDRPVHHASDSENEDAVNNQASDSETEEPPKGHGSDSENEEPQKPLASDSENEEPQKPLASDSENEESHKDHTSDLENEEPQKRPASDSENEEHQKSHDSDSENEVAPKPLASDSENEEPKVQPSDSETEDITRNKPEIETGDSNKEHKEEEEEEETENGAQLSDNEQLGKRLQDSDSEEEDSPKKQKLVDSDEEEGKEEEKLTKRKATVLSDSEDDEKTPAVKKSRIISDGEESDSDAASEKYEKQKKPLESDSEDEGDKADDGKKKEEKDLFGSDSESGNEQENLIADIFGESGDEEEEEFTGFNQEDLEEEKGERKGAADDSDSDDNIKRGKHMDFMSDFDMMLQRKKSMSGKRRRNRDGGTFISDADDVVSAMIVKMNEAAEEDRQLNTQKKPALKKLTLLPIVVMHLKKQDLKETFIDSGVMSAIKEWLSPLPDRSLPALKIREELLKILQELPSVSQETLKHSGIGRAVMYLYKHPKESRPNKDMAGKLINEWSRPIFGLTSNYKGMTREEREQRDLEQMPQRRRLSSSGGQTPRRDLEKVLTGEEKALRPGDPGFCARARVPMPSNKDYVVRPKWNVEMESSRPGTVKKGISRLEKHKRKFAEQKRLSKVHRAVKFSIEGNRMPL
ncbi:protein IWS1 homolog isoform X3 [Podarcis raffonei]|uniref:protein IWS1 homolog isoform X3 n=1 Tax=Podarcis raffonei TaxID=65483 RepID=UPI00232976F1|nr:protein IWS1 homolog isoform X3 [Podarcis raffonei]XP_053245604.1 protein IWS1 homolog isoform X3 [Podarcis raffonei]